MSSPEAAATAASRAAGTFTLEATAAGRFSAAGPLTFATARRACELGEHSLAAARAGALEISLGGITTADSAGLAVLLDWLGLARRAGRTLRFTELPQGLVALASISEVREMLERGT
jgi:phospholipid transport system transporter-binding protein